MTRVSDRSIQMVLLLTGLIICSPVGSAQSLQYSAMVVDSFDTGPGAGTAYFDLDCLDDQNCIVVGFRESPFLDSSDRATYGFVRRTTDGGATWQIVKTDLFGPPDYQLIHPVAVAYPDATLILVTTKEGLLYRSTDGGESWISTRPMNNHVGLQSLDMFDARFGVMLAGITLLYTEDGGADWRSIPYPDSLGIGEDFMGGVFHVTILNSHSLAIASFAGDGDSTHPIVIRTDDLGATWSSPTTVSDGFQRMVFRGDQAWGVGVFPVGNGHLSGNDLIVHSTDGGASWHEQVNQAVDPTFGLARLDFYDSLRGVAAGALGKLYVTIDGGRLWKNISMDPDLVSGFWGVTFVAENTAYLVGGNGTFVRLSIGTSSVRTDSDGVDDAVRILQDSRSIRLSFQERPCGPFRVTLTDLRGEEVAGTSGSNESEFQMLTEGLASGVYFLRVEAEGIRYQTEVMIRR